MTYSEIEDFPKCEGCIYFVDYKCTGEPENLTDCYRDKEDFINPAFERWWVDFGLRTKGRKQWMT